MMQLELVTSAYRLVTEVIGVNKSLGGDVESTIHLDGLMVKPTVVADENRTIVRNGKLLI